MSISSAPAATASAASSALIAERCLPDGNPTTDGDVQTRRRRTTWPTRPSTATRTPRTPRVRRPRATQRRHIGLGRLRLEQRVVDERGHALAAVQRRTRTVLRCRRDCSRAATISSSETSGRHGSRFQLVLPGSASSANCQWHRNCARMPGMSASGDERQHLGPRLVGLCSRCRVCAACDARRLRRVDAQAGQVAPLRPFGVVDVRRAGRPASADAVPAPGRGQQLHAATAAARIEAHATSATFPGSRGSWAGRRRDRRPRRTAAIADAEVIPEHQQASSTPPPRITSQTGLVSLSAAV